MTAAYQFGQHALRQHGVSQIEPRELVLVRMRRHRQVLQAPIVERAVVLEFERAERVGDTLDGVGLPVREIVARVYARVLPVRGCYGVQNAIEHGVAQVDIAGSHVDFGAQYTCTVGKFAGTHAAEQVEILVHAAAAIRTVDPGLGQRAAVSRISSWVWSST